ncbi:MAG: malectin domain-containing carbohydrate-binding protein [Verrucomicrobiales bacterium]
MDKGGNESEAGPAAAAEKGAYVRRINCGGDRVTGADGIEWEADTGNIFNTGRFKAGVRIEGAPDDMQPIYQSERWANAGLRYRFPVEPGDYEVILYLAESNKEFMEAGKRTFDVAINNEVVKAAVDVFAQAEGANKALELRFLTKPDPAGDIVVDLRKGVAGPALKGVEVRAVEVVE